jgi:predicted nucleotidyltransferase component of viral defense system
MEIDDLKSLAGRKKIPQGIIYKDYVITAILEKISEKSYSDKLIFKGGTCLKKIYFEETRFSVDIDFTCLEDGISDKLITDLKTELEYKTIRSVTFDKIKENGRWENSVSYKVKYKDLNEHPNSVKIDISHREVPILEPEIRNILNPDYDQIPDFKLKVFPLKEILAEKFRAVFTRNVARDVFDVWFLLRKGVEIDLRLVEKKMEIYDDIEFKKDDFINRIEEKRDDWERDLRMLVPESPGFDIVMDYIEKELASFDRQ